MEKHIFNAEKKYKEGLEALKTGLFKWNKDYASAAMAFDDAVKLYKLAKDSQGAVKTYYKLIECNDKLNDHWSLAKNHENIILLAMEDPTLKISDKQILDLTEKAALYFKGANSSNNYFLLAQKVCKYFEKKGDFENAIALYEQAFIEMEDEKAAYMRMDMVNTYLSALITVGRYGDAAEFLGKEINARKADASHKGTNHLLCMTVIVLHLLNGDSRTAETKLHNYATDIHGFVHSRELEV
eukprot:CAMPEP_0176433428 /NCGR_PEP_ID=MMETSP0127-20121128/16017_1 /TAXON_ID=938130 /ORGANISM="Platyophrya macrostoma, Strain WH" /LENGTH=240 /DNA_ID=CAMNT_0017815855 /DNA_START=6 /DNA_END=724 /DNA_ORIENTATION=-